MNIRVKVMGLTGFSTIEEHVPLQPHPCFLPDKPCVTIEFDGAVLTLTRAQAQALGRLLRSAVGAP